MQPLGIVETECQIEASGALARTVRRIMSQAVVQQRLCRAAPAARSGEQGWQPDSDTIAERGDGFQCHGAGALHCPFIVLVQQQGADQLSDGVFVGEDADNIAAALDLAIESFDRIGGADLRPMLGWKAHVGRHVSLGIVLGKGGADPG